MRSIEHFDDATIEELFGADDAENEKDQRFKQYFYFNNAFTNTDNDLPIRIVVGHKGIGKSALLKRAFLSDREKNYLAIKLEPGDLLNLMSDASGDDLRALAERWKDGLLAAIATKVISEFTKDVVEKTEIVGLGSKVEGFLNILSRMLTARLKKITEQTDKVIVETLAQAKAIHVYIDDIDRGWTASQKDVRNISALLTAVRDIAGKDQRIRFRIGLRTDAYYLVRTSDETTDKIERNVVWLSWTSHEILALIAKRITTFFGEDHSEQRIASMTQAQISEQILSRIMEPRFQGNGHWSNRPIHNVLTSLSRRRPRDMIKLLHGAARKAFSAKHSKISSKDLESSFETYSGERVQDIINEFKTELPTIDRLVFGFRPSRKGKKAKESFLFTTDTMVIKIRNIMQGVPLQFKSGKLATPRSVMQFLYKIEFITARKDSSEGIERKHFDQNRFLADEISEFGYDWEIHPAYRWALQPHDANRILDSITP